MKLFIATLALCGMTLAAHAQTTSSGAISGSNASNANLNASVSNVRIDNPGRVTTQYDGSYRIESAPAVSAPAIFGGGHPCLAGKSGGLSVVGGGFSYGQGDPEPACMAWLMGNPEIAMQIMMESSPKFYSAACRVGYFRIGSTKAPVVCPNRLPARTSSKAKPKTGGVVRMEVKCVGKVPHVTAKVAAAYSKKQLAAACSG